MDFAAISGRRLHSSFTEYIPPLKSCRLRITCLMSGEFGVCTAQFKTALTLFVVACYSIFLSYFAPIQMEM
jgi:hypothetical protein